MHLSSEACRESEASLDRVDSEEEVVEVCSEHCPRFTTSAPDEKLNPRDTDDENEVRGGESREDVPEFIVASWLYGEGDGKAGG